MTKSFGRHTIKAGFSFQDIIASNSFIQRARGDYDYSTLSLFLLDYSPDSLGERSVGVQGGIPAGYLFSAGYVSDDFRVSSNLTLNLGVRRIRDGTGRIALSNLQCPGESSRCDFFRHTAVSGKNNWAPRLGFAWSPGNSHVWSVRGGFGISYDQSYNNLSINEKPAYFQQTEDVNLNVQTPNFLANGGFPPPTQYRCQRR